jgi:hypothetical protein
VSIDARDGKTYLNGLDLMLDIGPLAPDVSTTGATRPTAMRIPQVGPGQYALSVAAPAASSLATLRHDAQVIDRIPLAERYPPEFDAIGVDRAALAELAQRTGGQVIEPDDTDRLNLPRPRRGRSLVGYLSAAGALLLGAGLIRWRMSA